MELPIGVFTIAVSTVVFPLIARYAAAGDLGNLAVSYRKGMRLILVINVPAAVGLAVLATPIIRLLFQRGEFDANATLLMQPVLIVSALGLPFISFVSIMLRAFYAQKDTSTPVQAALLSFLVNLGLSLAMMKPLGTVGLALAGTIAVVAQAVYLQVHLARKQPGLGFRHVRGDLVKVLVSAAVMGLVIAVGNSAWAEFAPPTKLADALGLTGLISMGVAVYGALVWRFRIEDREQLRAIIARIGNRLGR